MALMQRELAFFQRLLSCSEQANFYGDPVRLSLARSILPADLATTDGKPESILPLLLRWFKTTFFSWVDSLPCERCGGATVTGQTSLEPTVEELRFGASRVEAHFCESCGIPTRFPRFNDPAKLLETRRGRCGEWANCFTLCVSAAGLEARLVHDETDHVWTEVWSPTEARWLHCDACEAALDSPLLYEVGWGKKLSYCVAFSPTDVLDVSWRYSRDHKALRRRRDACAENALIQLQLRLRANKQAVLTAARQKELAERLVKELVELMLEPREAKESEEKGRSSGSLQWRVARKELGKGPRAQILRPEGEELRRGEFRLEYWGSEDEWRRPLVGPGRTESGWERTLYSAKRVARKEELDHGQAYVAREPGWSGEGELVWRVRGLAGLGLRELRLRLPQTTFGSGSVLATVCAGDACHRVPPDGELEVMDGLESTEEVEVRVVLSHGDGNVAWQHAQLFRAPLRPVANSQPHFHLTLRFNPAST